MNIERLKNDISIASGEKYADLVIKNGNVINVFTNEIIEEDIAISNGIIVGVGKNYSGIKEIDLKGKYISPGFIDGHVHIESAMVGPKEFAKAIVPRGVTTIIADPHEIGNVKGIEGIEYILNESEDIPLDVFVMLPSCVPSTDFENAGATLLADDLEKLINHERVLGLGEMMNFQGVINSDEKVMEKLLLAKNNNKIIDGHGPGLSGKDLNAYVIGGIDTEHECSTSEEMLERLRLGMYIQIREGSAARNLKDLIGVVNKDNLRRCIFCTDDKHPSDFVNEGSIDHNIRKSISIGLDPVDCIKMASLNASECYGLKDRGAVAPGYIADLVVIDNLEDFKIEAVYKKGILVGENLEARFETQDNNDISNMLNTVKINEINKEDLEIKLNGNKVNIIKLIPNNLVTEKVEREVKVIDGKYISDEDNLKLAVIERHNNTGNIGLGIIEGFGLKNGAIATTVGHDSHNLIVIGDNDEDMLIAINRLKGIGGGLVVVSKSKVLGELALEIGGIVSKKPLNELIIELDKMIEIGKSLGVNDGYDPFMTLSFMALPVIPSIKLTDMGLFDVDEFKFLELEIV